MGCSRYALSGFACNFNSLVLSYVLVCKLSSFGWFECVVCFLNALSVGDSSCCCTDTAVFSVASEAVDKEAVWSWAFLLISWRMCMSSWYIKILVEIAIRVIEVLYFLSIEQSKPENNITKQPIIQAGNEGAMASCPIDHPWELAVVRVCRGVRGGGRVWWGRPWP